MTIRKEDTITYWTPASNDGTGGITWNAGVAIPAAVSEKVMVIINEDGKSVSTRYAVYVESVIPNKSMIYIGDEDGVANPVSDARMIVESSGVASMTTDRRYLI